jgi:hypothetical protein
VCRFVGFVHRHFRNLYKEWARFAYFSHDTHQHIQAVDTHIDITFEKTTNDLSFRYRLSCKAW